MTHAVVGFGTPGDILSLIQDAEVDALFAIGWAQLYTGPIPPAPYPVAVSTGVQTLTDVQAQQVRTNLELARAVTPEQYGARGDGTTDDLAAINQALAHSSAVQLDDKFYAISGPVVVGPNQTLVGKGGMRVNHGTVLRALTSTATLQIKGDAPHVADLTFDGNGVAAIGVQDGGYGPLDAGSDGVISNVMSTNCVQKNWLVAGSQNRLYSSCRSQGGPGEGFVVDYSAGGLLIQRLEAAGSAGPNIHVTQSASHTGGYQRVADVVFDKCIAEQSSIDVPQVFVERGYSVTFRDLSVYSSVAGATAPLIKVSGSGVVRFHNPLMLGQAGQVGIEAAFLPGEGFARVMVTGLVETATITTGLFRADATSTIWFQGYSPQVATGALPLREAGTSPFAVRDERANPVFGVAQASADAVVYRSVVGDTQYRFVQTGDGSMLWGSGAAAGDTNLIRAGVGVLGTNGAMLAFRRLAPSPVIAPVSGTVTVDASVSDKQAVGITGTVTALVINKMEARQLLKLTFIQAASPNTFAIASVTGTQADGSTAIAGIQWRGGAAPALTTGSKAVTCEFAMIGGVLYETNRLSTDPANP